LLDRSVVGTETLTHREGHATCFHSIVRRTVRVICDHRALTNCCLQISEHFDEEKEEREDRGGGVSWAGCRWSGGGVVPLICPLKYASAVASERL
jgi:hypothetical protein